MNESGRTTRQVLKAALAHHRAGRLDAAAELYELVLAGEPLHPDALHYLGVVAHQRRDFTRAVDLIGRAAACQPLNAACHCNLAEAYRGLGRRDEAEAACRKALELRPGYPEALLNLAVILFDRGRFDEAGQACRSALRLRPGFAAAAVTLADILREQWRIGEALEAYRRALDLAPQLWAPHANYGLLLVQRGEMDEGLRHCRQAVRLAPGVALPHQNLGSLLLEYGRIEEAMEVLGTALKLEPNSPSLCLAIGSAWAELAELDEARRWFARALELDPDRTEARSSLGDILLESGDPDGAARIYREVLQKEPDRVDALAGLARARLDQGDVGDSVAAYREALRLRPEMAGLHAALGHTLSTAGDLPGAIACQRKAIELNPDCVAAYGGLLTTLRDKATDSELLKAEDLLNRAWMTDKLRATLHFGLAHACDGRGDWERAGRHMVQANAFRKQYWDARGEGYDPAGFSLHVDRLIQLFSPAFFERVRGFGVSSERPVFIVGLPRSGTTLAEQILASHPRVFGAGERAFAVRAFERLPRALGRQDGPFDCVPHIDAAALEEVANWHLEQLRRLDGGRADRIVDKLPDNYLWLGFLQAAFPKARFIHCRRDVRDVALSCWITHFSQIRWAFDLEHIAHRIQQYRRIMEHWGRVLPVPVLELDYEALIADQEGVSHRLVDWLGLEWDERCLSFHRTERLVRTASVSQVRQPIYRRSVARWKHYETMLRPLLDILR